MGRKAAITINLIEGELDSVWQRKVLSVSLRCAVGALSHIKVYSKT